MASRPAGRRRIKAKNASKSDEEFSYRRAMPPPTMLTTLSPWKLLRRFTQVRTFRSSARSKSLLTIAKRRREATPGAGMPMIGGWESRLALPAIRSQRRKQSYEAAGSRTTKHPAKSMASPTQNLPHV